MSDIKIQIPELDAKSFATLLGGFALTSTGLFVIAQVPQARAVCARFLNHPQVKTVFRNVVSNIAHGVGTSIGGNIQQMPAPLAR